MRHKVFASADWLENILLIHLVTTKKIFAKLKKLLFSFIVRQTEMPLFGKKKTVEQQMREQDREMRRVNRGLERDRGQLDKGLISQIYYKGSKKLR